MARNISKPRQIYLGERDKEMFFARNISKSRQICLGVRDEEVFWQGASVSKYKYL